MFYIAGPMRGYEDFNMHEFDRVAELLRSRGFKVVNPIDIDREKGVELHGKSEIEELGWDRVDMINVIQRDIEALLGCSDIVLLQGWRDSVGACAELGVAIWAGLKIWELDKDGSTIWQVDTE
jgi:nucleoside 2-deoxyribosyltransferase